MSTSTITVRYWAAARTAAGTDHDELVVDGPITLAEVVRRAIAQHPEGRLPGVLEVCSVLVGERPVKTQDPARVEVRPGDSVEFLPPFAGG
jgi:molybdopterin converting factor small subunit